LKIGWLNSTTSSSHALPTVCRLLRNFRTSRRLNGGGKRPINTVAWQTKQAYDAVMTLVPYRRIGEPDDGGKAGVWLASDQADYVVGATLYVDGGMTLFPGFATGVRPVLGLP
jgi:glucose 1-dehydrogenase